MTCFFSLISLVSINTIAGCYKHRSKKHLLKVYRTAT